MPGSSFTSWTQTPVTTPPEVRLLSGYLGTKDISEADVAANILKAQGMVMSETATRVHDVKMEGPLDGVNTRFQVPGARVFLDAEYGGNEKTSMQVLLRKPSTTNGLATWDAATVSSVDALHGQVVLSVAPNPAVYDRVCFTGLLIGAPLSVTVFKTCVELLTCHLLDLRARGPSNVNMANPTQPPENDGGPRRSWMSLYRMELHKLRGARPRVASIKTSR